ncbi:putative transmembrane protein [Senna tora]|uniref:Putative transmembrane protein n=1 Tax=Senna tora TaxID=362788 RepID=A0A834TCB3_9FABA|nr:putative transmembrane protein [Senna tora]
MAATDGIVSDQKFPPADVDGTLNPASNKQVQVDPVSSEVAVSKENKEQDEIKRKEKEDAMRKLKSGIIISAIVVAVAGAVFAITKKLREK